MKTKLTTAVALGLLIAACSQEPAANPEADAEAPAAALDADDDTLEPEAPVIEEGEEHNEDAPHSH